MSLEPESPNLISRKRGSSKDGSLYAHVGKRIREARTRAGMSQNTLGKYCGVTFQQLQKYEQGTNRVPVDRLLDIARILGVGLDYFLDGYQGIDLGTMDNPSRTDIGVSVREARVFAEFRRDNPEAFGCLVEFVKAYTRKDGSDDQQESGSEEAEGGEDDETGQAGQADEGEDPEDGRQD